MLLFEPDGDILPHNGEDICEWFNGGVTVEPDAVAASACGADIELGEQLEKHRFTSSKSLVVVAVVVEECCEHHDDDDDIMNEKKKTKIKIQFKFIAFKWTD